MEEMVGAMLENSWFLLLMAFGIPSFMTRRMEKRMDERERKADLQERNREEMNRLQVKATMAAIALGEATARAVQRIPDAHCNGDMTAALDYVKAVKHEEKDFLTGLGIHALYEE